jgi:probable DNA repair protein
VAERESRISPELDKWLLDGGRVVASSERAARFVATEFNHARRSEGRTVWLEPGILTWSSYVRELWEQLQSDGRMLLTPAQEVALWESILAGNESLASILSGPRHHLAALAQDAHQLICAYAPEALDAKQRTGWQNDAEKMSEWLVEFDSLCAKNALLSTSRLPLELLAAIESEPAIKEQLQPVKLIGFDRFEPAQRKLLDAIGKWELATNQSATANRNYYKAADSSEELRACVSWCGRQLAANPNARLLVLTNDAAMRRGEIERAFTRWLNTPHSPAIEFSLGVPLSSVPMVRAAVLMLRWLSAQAKEDELDWLFASGFSAQSSEETAALLRVMREIRHKQWQRPEWRMQEFSLTALQLQPQLGGWCERFAAASTLLDTRAANHRTAPREWSLLVFDVLDALGWPGHAQLSSAQFQARQRFEQLVESTAGFGFDGRSIRWSEYQTLLEQQLAETLFVAESREAPILIAGPAESAGLTADGIWMLGAEEGTWPAPGSTNPLLPLSVQRTAGMPHSTAAVDWQLARQITERLLNSAPEICFSFAALREGQETKRSRLIEQLAGMPQPLPADLHAQVTELPLDELVSETRVVPYTRVRESGGADVLSDQSKCPFMAFAEWRLNAECWKPAEPGLTALEKGNMLHEAMHSIWRTEQEGIHRRIEDIKMLAPAGRVTSEIESFVRQHVRAAIQKKLSPSTRARALPATIEIEEDRLTRIIVDWLLYETSRQSFEVIELEKPTTVNVGALALNLRIDRIDKLNDDSLLVIDYKSGKADRNVWKLPRPEDVQLPLYACYATQKLNAALEKSQQAKIGGWAFAKINAAEVKLDGLLREARATLSPKLSGNSGMVKEPLTDEMLFDWQTKIRELADDFVDGVAEVDPIEPMKTCEWCELQVLCRRQECDIEESNAAEDGND